MARLTKPDHFRLQWDSYRLTSDKTGYEVLAGILFLSVFRSRPVCNSPLQGLVNIVQELREQEARLYALPIPPLIDTKTVIEEVSDLAARGVVDFDFPREDHIIVEPLISAWPTLASVRIGSDGNPVRRTAI